MTRPFDPPPALRDWLENDPVRQVRLWDGSTAWLVTRHADVRAVMRNEACISVDPRRPGFTQKSAAYSAVLGTDRNLRTLDNPEHGIQKRMLVRDFTLQGVAALEPGTREIIETLIGELLAKGPPADLFQDLAFLVPTRVICNLLGVPFEDRRFFAERSTACISHVSTFAEAAAAGQELYDYLDRIVGEKERRPGEDLLSRLVAGMRDGAIAREDLIGLARFLLIAGHDSTANTMALSALALLRHPDQLADLKAGLGDRARVTNAVDELLRYLSVAHTGRQRVTVAPIEVGGWLIPAGQPIVLANNVADRDARVFPDPDRLDLRRPNARAALVFGDGVHQCLGQQLARRELILFHEILWRRIPGLRLAMPFEEIRFVESGTIYAVETLPVAWS